VAYVYRHIREDNNEPFYIGIGKELKRAYSKTNRNKHWNSIINLTDYYVDVLFNDLSWDEAKEKEKEFIKLYKRKCDGGPLCNITLGGEGVLGLIHTYESKIKMGKPNKGKIISKKHREIISKVHTNKFVSEETRIKISKSSSGKKNGMYGKKRSEEAKLKTSIANRGESNKSSKLTNELVLKIREMYKTENISLRKLSLLFNVSKSSILNVIKRKTWNHI